MPRSSRGSTSHRGHRTRGRHNEPAETTTPVATPEETPAEGDDVEATSDDQQAVAPTPAPRAAVPTPQPLAAAVSGTTMRGDPLLTKELIRITVLAVVVMALLVTFTTLVR